MTRAEFNLLPSNHTVACPDCGLKLTKPYPNCGCPISPTGYGTQHINLYHHDCEEAWARAYPTNKNNIGHGAAK